MTGGRPSPIPLAGRSGAYPPAIRSSLLQDRTQPPQRLTSRKTICNATGATRRVMAMFSHRFACSISRQTIPPSPAHAAHASAHDRKNVGEHRNSLQFKRLQRRARQHATSSQNGKIIFPESRVLPCAIDATQVSVVCYVCSATSKVAVRRGTSGVLPCAKSPVYLHNLERWEDADPAQGLRRLVRLEDERSAEAGGSLSGWPSGRRLRHVRRLRHPANFGLDGVVQHGVP